MKQSTDHMNKGKDPNADLGTTSKSPKTTGSPAWRTDADDNNGHHGRVTSVKERPFND